jgi:hypothetical protein
MLDFEKNPTRVVDHETYDAKHGRSMFQKSALG